jgi:hypothetical protein
MQSLAVGCNYFAIVGAEYYLRDTAAAFSRGVGKDWWKTTALTTESLIKRIVTTQGISELALLSSIWFLGK